MIVEARIAAYLDKTGRTRSFVARETKISKSRISQVLNGKSSLKVDEFEKIVNALHVDPNNFIERDQNE